MPSARKIYAMLANRAALLHGTAALAAHGVVLIGVVLVGGGASATHGPTTRQFRAGVTRAPADRSAAGVLGCAAATRATGEGAKCEGAKI
jgi:hypothetical protein